jgi:hypothetical protein
MPTMGTSNLSRRWCKAAAEAVLQAKTMILQPWAKRKEMIALVSPLISSRERGP